MLDRTQPVDWRPNRLCELGELVGGRTPSRDHPGYWGGDTCWIAPGELTAHRAKYVYETAERITKAGLNSCGTRVLPPNSLLVTTRATLGLVAIAGCPIATNQGFRSIIPNGKVDPNFLYHLLPTLKADMVRRASGTTFLEISGTQFGQIVVLLPDRPEQQRIAEILDTLDEAIRKTEGVIAKLRQMKQGLLHDLLTRGLDDNGELRYPDRHPEQFHMTPLGRLPKGWDVTTGKEVCREIVVGIVIRPAQYYVENGVPVLRSANVREDGLTLDDLVFMSERSHRALAKSAVGPGDVVTVRTGYPGTTCVIPSDVETANCVDIIISRVGPLVSSKFLAIWVNSDFGRGQVLRQQGGLAQQHFNVGEMKSLKLVRPTIIEQSAIVTRVEAFERRLRNEQIELAKLQKLKSGLMDDLLTGRVRVTKLIEKAA